MGLDEMEKYIIEINWEGPLKIDEVIRDRGHEGDLSDSWEKCDYGVYQIYGPHIIYGKNVLLYIGQAAKETFSQRFREHRNNLLKDDNLRRIRIYLGRLKGLPKYTARDKWRRYYRDVDIVESVLIYKYLPSYNGSRKGDYPKLYYYKKIGLVHNGSRKRLKSEDNAPKDYKKQ